MSSNKTIPKSLRVSDERDLNGAYWIIADLPHMKGIASVAEVRPGCTEAGEAFDIEAIANLFKTSPDMAQVLQSLLDNPTTKTCLSATGQRETVEQVLAKALGQTAAHTD